MITRQPQIVADDLGKLGPAMQALPSDRMRNFVAALCQTGGGAGRATEAAILAGYHGDKDTLYVTAYRLMHDERIQAALVEEGRRRMTAAAILATSRLVEMVDDTDKKVRLKAIDMLLNRIGLHATQEHKVIHKTEVSDDELVGRITALATKLGLDPQALLGNSAPVSAIAEGDRPREAVEDTIDAEYEVVAAPTAEGLEDLL